MEHIDDREPRSNEAATGGSASAAATDGPPAAPSDDLDRRPPEPADAADVSDDAPSPSRRETAADVCAWFGFVPTALLVVSSLVLSAMPGEIALNALLPFFGLIGTGLLWAALAITALVLGLRRPRRPLAIWLAVATLALYGVVIGFFMAVGP